MLAQQTVASPTITNQLSEQAAQAVPRYITDLHARREEASHAGPSDAVIELHIFTSVKILIKQAGVLKNFPAVSHGYALRWDIAFDVAVDPRLRMMSQPRRPRQGDRALEMGRAGDV